MHPSPEILAPAGDATGLAASLKAGADAVYFGVSGFNMRAAARNFTLDNLGETVARIHQAGAKAYLALNIIVFEEELGGLETVLDAAANARVDAVIAWDPAVLEACVERGIEPHLSTQASAANSAAIAAAYRQWGIKRFVLAREVSLDSLNLLRKGLTKRLGDAAEKIELEAFAHGALCVSLSGRCFLSQFSTGHSGNRGACLQPCRREYRVTDLEGDYEYRVANDAVFSPEDLCTMPFLEKLIDAGIASLKIEGRNRNPEYAATVVRAYRRAVDAYAGLSADGPLSDKAREEWDALKVELTTGLRTVYNRGFSSGFYMGRPIGDWTGQPGSQATFTKASVGTVTNFYKKPSVAEIRVQARSFSPGDTLLIQGPTTGSLEVTVEAIQVEHDEVARAEKGMDVAVRVPDRVRRNDLVFLRIPREA